jgi:EAL domain-containing protein (putative c-di-GMP-specific phosphodiesterase class I)
MSFARALGLSVTAEGVETAGQLAELREMGCDLA